MNPTNEFISPTSAKIYAQQNINTVQHQNTFQDELKSIDSDNNFIEYENFSGFMLNKKKIFSQFNVQFDNQRHCLLHLYYIYDNREQRSRERSIQKVDQSRNDSSINKFDNSMNPINKKRSMRDILLSKGLNFRKSKERLSQPNALQSFIMQRVVLKAKVSLIVKAFIKNMIGNLDREKLQFFLSSSKLRNLIGDKADSLISLKQYDFGYNNQNINNSSKNKFDYFCQLFSLVLLKFSQLINYIPVFEPLSQYSIIWDIVQLISLCFFFAFIPLNVCFGNIFEKQEGILLLCILLTILLISDLFVNFNTGIFYQGKVIIERDQVAKHYYQTGKQIK